jgi:hypothetical protein
VPLVRKPLEVLKCRNDAVARGCSPPWSIPLDRGGKLLSERCHPCRGGRHKMPGEQPVVRGLGSAADQLGVVRVLHSVLYRYRKRLRPDAVEVAQATHGSVDQGVAESGSFQIEKPDAPVAIVGIAGGVITVGERM